MQWASSLTMLGAMVAAYGSFAAFLARFLYPSRPARRGWLFIKEVAGLSAGDSLLYHLPNGSPVNVTRRGAVGTADDFIALSSTCPHLGCQVHWEAQNNRFFCPCHNGVFDPEGRAVSGPPGDAGQFLPSFPLKVENGLLFIRVPLDQLAAGDRRLDRAGGLSRPGHDRCLEAAPRTEDRA